MVNLRADVGLNLKRGGNHSGTPSDSVWIAPPTKDILCVDWRQLSDSESEPESACTIRVPYTAYSCGRHGPVTAWFWAARPGNVIPVPKTYTLL